MGEEKRLFKRLLESKEMYEGLMGFAEMLFRKRIKMRKKCDGVRYEGTSTRRARLPSQVHHCRSTQKRTCQLKTDQISDPDLRKIIKNMENGNPEEPNRWNGEYVITQGVLYRYSPDDDVEEAQLVVLTANRPSSYEIFMTTQPPAILEPTEHSISYQDNRDLKTLLAILVGTTPGPRSYHQSGSP